MLKIHIDSKEFWDEQNEEFVNIPGCDLELEHSLLSISEWEKKYHKSFTNTIDKTREETLDYIKMMVTNGVEVDDLTLFLLKMSYNFIIAIFLIALSYSVAGGFLSFSLKS